MARYGEKEDGRVARAQRARAERRSAVLAAARGIFADKGYHATSIDDIIEAAGIARGTFYLYFESKRAIFDELLDGLLETIQSLVHRIDVGEGAPPPVEQMDLIVDRVIDALSANRELARILLREAVGIDADFDRKLSDFYGRLRGMIVSASSHSSCSSAGLVSKASCSTLEADLPVPQLTRPSERMSSVAMRSAMRSGWL